MTANTEASVRARLRNKMLETGLEFQFLLTRYACERFAAENQACSHDVL